MPWDPSGSSSWEQEARVGSCSVTAEVGAFPGEGKPPCPWPSHGKGSGRFFPPRTGSGLGFGGRQARTRDCESEDLGPPEGSLLGCHSSGGSTPLRACVLACETGGLAPTCEACARSHTSSPRHRALGAGRSVVTANIAAVHLRDAENPPVSSSREQLPFSLRRDVSGHGGHDAHQGARAGTASDADSPPDPSPRTSGRAWAQVVGCGQKACHGHREVAEAGGGLPGLHGAKSAFAQASSVRAAQLSRS